jgi:processive 1,2-diacylglycerol beta-glucosyltransferase
MPQLMQVSDVLVTKAGGVTMMEALAMGLPMVLYGNIPGQEELNAQHVASHGAGIIARTVRDVQQAIGRLCDDPAALSQMRRQAEALACPDAALALVEQFLAGSAHGA